MAHDLTRSQDLVVLDGTTFVLSAPSGDIGGSAAHGYFHDDVRHLSGWTLLLDGEPLTGITGAVVDCYSARTVLAPSTGAGIECCVRRDRFVTEGVHEDLVVTNLGPEPRSLELAVRFAADFADLLAVRGGEDGPDPAETVEELDGATVLLSFTRDGVRRATRIAFGGRPRLEPGRAVFSLALPPRGEWRACVDVSAIDGAREAPPLLRCGGFRAREPKMPMALDEWLARAPELATVDAALARTYEQSLRDLAALRIRPRDDLPHAMPAGGLPWFMCVFGRDSVVASYEALPFEPTLAAATLRALAGMQARERDDWRDAEPGKLPHERRRGIRVQLGADPRDPYYGSHDATPLWLVLLDEYERWTGDTELVRELEAPARRALGWLDEHADLDGDGYVEYARRSPKGLRNQGWRDSDDAIAFADGRRAEPPVACCELQGYAHDARCRAARLAREVWGDELLATRLERTAAALKERFNRDFWNEARGAHLLALAGPAPKQRVDAVTSSAGQLLWSGIVDDAHAERLVARLLEPDLFTGWGIRTLSAEDAAFNPLGYHTGCVWPHDTALIAAGMRRYGYDEQAAGVATALLDAAAAFEHRLPECFAGFARDCTDVPVRYPAALVPQAWAAAAPLLALRTLLGLDAAAGRLRCDPVHADGPGELGLRSLAWRGEVIDVP